MSNVPQTDQKPEPRPSTLAVPPSSSASGSPALKESEGPLLFHFAECTNCGHLLPISTTTEKYFAILSKAPKTPVGLGEKCMRCGADCWVLITG